MRSSSLSPIEYIIIGRLAQAGLEAYGGSTTINVEAVEPRRLGVLVEVGTPGRGAAKFLIKGSKATVLEQSRSVDFPLPDLSDL